jgi:carotenoid 1,2-hydratase
MKAVEQLAFEKFNFVSSVADDAWHPKSEAKGYEWWYFDALSDDGRDAIVIIFLDNFIFSPRYNRKSKTDSAKPIPAIAFFYYRDGKPLFRAINEYAPEDFSASEKEPFCQIGTNYFDFKVAPYGSGYFISIETVMRGNCRLKAQFEWLTVEGDFKQPNQTNKETSHNWNLVAPRADVSGKINVENDKGKETDFIQFRGTGYHDHNYDNRWLPATVKDWQWGRVHFSDSTAVFYRYKECSELPAVTKLITIRDSNLRERDAEFEEAQLKRDIFGIKFPQRMTFTTEDNVRLRVKQLKTIDSSFFYLRFLSEMTLTLRDGKPRRSVGITELLSPKTLKYRWLDWMINMRIGRGGKGAILR